MSGYGRTVAFFGLVLAAGAFATAPAEAVVVNCAAPNAGVQNAVDGADGPTTIVVKGTCIGDVVIEKDDITLSGNRPGSICDKASPGALQRSRAP